MSESAPIILEKIVSGMTSSMPRQTPSAVYVLSYNSGKLRLFTRAPSIGDRMGSKYCYIIDASERHTSGKLSIPARDDVYFFQIQFEASWYVSDPVAVVRRNAIHGDELISSFLSNAMWRMGRNHSPNDAQGAENEILRSLRAPWNLGNGLTLTSIFSRVVLDQRQAGAVAEIDTDTHTGVLERNRFTRLRARLDDGDQSYVLEHLSQHPGDTGSVLQMLTATRERNEQTRLALFDRLVNQGYIQDADIGPLRDMILSGPPTTALTAGTAPAQAMITPIASPVLAAGPGQMLPAGSANALWPAPHAPTAAVPGPRTPDYEDVDPAAGPLTAPAPAAAGNVTNWKPVGRTRPARGPK